MPLPRFDKLPADKRRAILQAASREFAEHGFDGASFNRIIAAAGISKGAMYYYFADKADAYGAVLDDVTERMIASLMGLPKPRTASEYWDVLAAGMDKLNEFLFADPELAALVRGLYRGGGAESTYQRLLAQNKAWVTQLLELGRALGAVRDDVPDELLAEVAMGMLVALDRWYVEAAERMPPSELMALSPSIVRMLRDALSRASR